MTASGIRISPATCIPDDCPGVPDPEQAESDVRRALEVGGGRVVLKLPAQPAMFALGSQLTGEGRTVAEIVDLVRAAVDD